jgi:hypothetical protein
MAVHALEFHVSVHESNTSVPYQFLASSDMFRTLVNMLRLFYINFGETNHIWNLSHWNLDASKAQFRIAVDW